MNYEDLLKSVRSAAGLRLRLRLQPMYGEGEIVFPPTYEGGTYLISPRRIPGYTEAVDCAILDSVQSQANRLELALLEEIMRGEDGCFIPHAATDFTGVPNLEKEIGRITSLETPHRIFDAILRDSELNGVRFPGSEPGKAILQASSHNATPLFQYDPGSLIFGCWDSTGVSGGLGEKFTRCVVSEIIAVNAEPATRRGTRVDPLNISSAVDCAEIAASTKDSLWKDRQAKSKKDKGKASSINHGSIIWKADEHGGVTADYIQQAITISFPALRQLRFPVNGKQSSEVDGKAQTVLAAIALHAAALCMEKGWHLRSRCDLWLEQGTVPPWEMLGGESSPGALPASETRALLKEAVEAAKGAGLPWEEKPLELKPTSGFQVLARKSQQKQRESAGSEE